MDTVVNLHLLLLCRPLAWTFFANVIIQSTRYLEIFGKTWIDLYHCVLMYLLIDKIVKIRD